MKRVTTEYELTRRAQARLRMIQHYQQVTLNVSQTGRFYGISVAPVSGQWRRWPPGPAPRAAAQSASDLPHLEALILRVRQERQYGVVRLSLFLRRHHQAGVSPPTIYRVLKEHRMPRVCGKHYRPGSRRWREMAIPGQSVQVDVKHLKHIIALRVTPLLSGKGRTFGVSSVLVPRLIFSDQ